MAHMPEKTYLAILRILDANFDRIREGIRVIEDWCRLGLEDAAMTAACKQMRQELAQLHTSEIRQARDTANDPGTDLSHPHEESRASLEALLQANFCRCQEALRVIEEYSKLYNPQISLTVKQMRYELYTWETNLLVKRRHRQLAKARTYLVTCSRDHLLTTVEHALQGGVEIVQYREKQADDRQRLTMADKLCQLCHHYGALFIVNDRPDLALAVDADGVHLGQQDLPVALARQMLGPSRIIGQSTTNPDEMQRAIEQGADYIGVGPVYATPTKPDKPAAGLDYVRYAAAHAPMPWFAIGGIDIHNLGEVLNAGAERVAVVRAIMDAEQPTLASQFFNSQISHRQNMIRLEQTRV